MRSKVLSVRQAIRALRQALLNPSLEGIDAVVSALQQGAVVLEQLRSEPGDPGCRADLEALARELRGAARLAAQGLDVSRGTLRLLAASYCQSASCQSASYQSDGEPAPLHPTATVLVRG